MIEQIPYWKVEEAWPEAAPLLQKVITTQDEWTLEAVYRRLINPYETLPLQLWLERGKFALVTQVITFPTGVRKCLLFLCGGSDLEAIAGAQAAVEQWARKYMGCSKTILYGRRGWLRSLDGYTASNTIMEKNLWPQ